MVQLFWCLVLVHVTFRGGCSLTWSDAETSTELIPPTRPGESPNVKCTSKLEYYACRYWSCPKTCEQWSFSGNPWDCEEMSKSFCEYSCRCIPGYYYNAEGICVPEAECSAGCSDPNAVMKTCPNPCPVTCENVLLEERPVCNKSCPESGCICNSGYVLGPEGKCVAAKDCPNLSCPADKTLNRCVPYCSMPNTCDGFFNFIDCVGAPNVCMPKCLCPEGLYSNGTACVTPSECCGQNQETVSCQERCDRTCQGTEVCYSCLRQRCVCKEGYLRLDGQCVRPEECSTQIKCSGPNEEFNTCMNKCKPTCQTLGTGTLPEGCTNSSSQEPCQGGCDCKPGYIRDQNNVCIPLEECPCNGENQIRKACGDPCPKTCDNLNHEGPMICPAVCIENGCSCKPGFVRNSTGDCVFPENCPKKPCDDPNKIRTPCGNPCPLTCENLENPPIACPKICLIDGCVCKENLVLDQNGKCVDPKDCPCKKKNQIRTNCGNYCPITCENKDRPRRCKKICFPNGCTCKPGYVEDINGNCIRPKKCHPCGDKNALYLPCGDPCPVTCDNMDDPPKICKKRCISRGCACKEGYVKDARGKCIKPIKCPCKHSCEVRTACGDFCPLTCDNKDDAEPRECPVGVCYANGCTCKKGYLRNREGECVRPSQCPSCNDENAVMKPCADSCPLTCENIDNPPAICPEPCITYGCVCKPGYARDKEWKCVKATDCPCRGKNEVRLPCGDPCPVTCGNVNNQGPRVCPAICKVNGCACKDGYVRNEKGECILPENCPAYNCEDYNAVVQPCGDPCPITCENMNDPPAVCHEICIVNGCMCKPGFVKNSEGKCVDPLQCPCRGSNEVRLSCGEPCPITCDNLHEPGPRVCPFICLTNQCACLDGYVRNPMGQCVLPRDCDKYQTNSGYNHHVGYHREQEHNLYIPESFGYKSVKEKKIGKKAKKRGEKSRRKKGRKNKRKRYRSTKKSFTYIGNYNVTQASSSTGTQYTSSGEGPTSTRAVQPENSSEKYTSGEGPTSTRAVQPENSSEKYTSGERPTSTRAVQPENSSEKYTSGEGPTSTRAVQPENSTTSDQTQSSKV